MEEMGQDYLLNDFITTDSIQQVVVNKVLQCSLHLPAPECIMFIVPSDSQPCILFPPTPMIIYLRPFLRLLEGFISCSGTVWSSIRYTRPYHNNYLYYTEYKIVYYRFIFLNTWNLEFLAERLKNQLQLLKFYLQILIKITISMAYGTRKFNAVFTRAFQYPYPETIQFIILTHLFKSHSNIVHPSTPRAYYNFVSGRFIC